MEQQAALEGMLAKHRSKANAETCEPSLEFIYDTYAGPLYRYLLTLLGDQDEAEDAVQEVLLGMVRRQSRGGIKNLRAYLFQAARRQAFLMLRQRLRRERELDTTALSWIDLEACEPTDCELALDIGRALSKLPMEQREVLALKLGEGMTFREIAETLGISLNTAASRYRLAIARLRDLLASGE